MRSPIPLNILIKDQPQAIAVDGKTYEVYDIMAIYRVRAVKTTNGYNPQFATLEDAVPLFSRTIPQFIDLIKEAIPGSDPQIKQVEYGFTRENASRHYIRIVIPKQLQITDGDNDAIHDYNGKNDFFTCFTLQSDFSNSSDPGRTLIDVGLYRLVCNNGLTVPIDPQTYKNLKQQYIDRGLQAQNLSTPTPENANLIEAATKQLDYKFNSIFSSKSGAFSFKVSNALFNKNEGLENIKDAIGFLGDTDTLIRTVIDPLKEDLPQVENLDFLKALTESAHGKVSNSIVNAIAVEYLSERLPNADGTPNTQVPLKIRRPIDIVNMVTFLAQSAKDSGQQVKMEQKVIPFVNKLTDTLRGQNKEDQEILERFKGLLHTTPITNSIN